MLRQDRIENHYVWFSMTSFDKDVTLDQVVEYLERSSKKTPITNIVQGMVEDFEYVEWQWKHVYDSFQDDWQNLPARPEDYTFRVIRHPASEDRIYFTTFARESLTALKLREKFLSGFEGKEVEFALGDPYALENVESRAEKHGHIVNYEGAVLSHGGSNLTFDLAKDSPQSSKEFYHLMSKSIHPQYLKTMILTGFYGAVDDTPINVFSNGVGVVFRSDLYNSFSTTRKISQLFAASK